MTKLQTRLATLRDVEMMLDWAAAEGWNPGLADAASFFRSDPEGFIVTVADDQPVAAISVVCHSPEFAFLGLYICRPEFRGRGLGLATWNAALAHAGARTIGLDGVKAQQDNYRKSGFVAAGSSLRYEGPALPRRQSAIRAFADSDMAAVVDLDIAANGYERLRFLRAWLAPDATRRSVVLGGGSGIAGYATARQCRDGVKIGPVIAPDTAAAIDLIAAAAAHIAGSKVIVDVPEANAGLRAALADAGYAVTFGTARMYRGPAPRASSLLQAIGTMELG